MATFEAIVARVVAKYKGGSSSDITTQAGLAVNDAIEYYQREHFWFTEGTATLTLTQGNPELTTASGYPSDFWYFHPNGALAIVQSQSRYPLEKVSITDYDRRNTQGTGRPDCYREIDDTIQVYPYPDQAYTLEFRYIKKYTTLSGSESNDWTNYAPQLIEARALSMMFLSQGQDEAAYKRWETEELKQYNALRLTNHQRIATGYLSTDEC